jgi:Ca2+-binding RTX toxin-like protein
MIKRTGTALSDILTGTAEADEFQAEAGDDTLFGNGGPDLFVAGAGHDRLHGGGDRDTMLGGEGNDTIFAEGGDDSVEGGEGSDLIYAAAGSDTVWAGAGDDLVEAGGEADLVDGGAGNDEIQGEGGSDTIAGGQDDGRLVWSTPPTTSVTPPPGGTTPPGGSTTPPGEVCGPAKLFFSIANTHDGSKPGNPAVQVEVTEGVSGTLLFHVKVVPNGTNVADLRGLFLNIKDEGLASSLVATSTQVLPSGGLITLQKGQAHAIDALSRDVTMNGSKQLFDFALSFGTQGLGKDDVREAVFTLDSTAKDLTLDMFAGVTFGARLTSFGAEGGSRGGSLKLLGNSGEVEVCAKAAAPLATTAVPQAPTPAPLSEAVTLAELRPVSEPVLQILPAAAGPATLERVVIGDNLYGNDGADTFIFARGDGVDLIWDFQAGRDIVEVKGYTLADLDAFTFVARVENAGRDGRHPLDAGTHEKLAVILDASGDAIVFNDLGDRSSTAAALRFEDGTTISVREMLARAAQPAPVAGDEVSATVRIVHSWWGGFQGEVTVTANRAVQGWDVALGLDWQLQALWDAQQAGVEVTDGGRVYDLDDAGWNASLAAGQRATFGFTASTGVADVLSAKEILDGIWIRLTRWPSRRNMGGRGGVCRRPGGGVKPAAANKPGSRKECPPGSMSMS